MGFRVATDLVIRNDELRVKCKHKKRVWMCEEGYPLGVVGFKPVH